MLTFAWDERKAAANLKKHGVSFDEARTVFSDEHARLIADPDNSDDEDRFIILGLSERTTTRLLVVCQEFQGKRVVQPIKPAILTCYTGSHVRPC
jgi:hypothetical protein